MIPNELPPSVAQHAAALATNADRFFGRVFGAFREHMRCSEGCTDCCHPDLTVVQVEAILVRQAISALPLPMQDALRERARAGASLACALLLPDGRCSVYGARPLICRTHGVPIVHPPASELSVCPKNFQHLASLPKDAVLDGSVLATQLAAVDAEARRSLGSLPYQRFALRELVLQPFEVVR